MTKKTSFFSFFSSIKQTIYKQIQTGNCLQKSLFVYFPFIIYSKICFHLLFIGFLLYRWKSFNSLVYSLFIFSAFYFVFDKSKQTNFVILAIIYMERKIIKENFINISQVFFIHFFVNYHKKNFTLSKTILIISR